MVARAAHTRPPEQKETYRVAGTNISVTRVGVAEARDDITGILSNVAEGSVYLIQNARNVAAPAALVISATQIEAIVHQPKVERTLLELVQALPMRIPGEEIPRAHTPDDFAPDLRVPQARGAE